MVGWVLLLSIDIFENKYNNSIAVTALSIKLHLQQTAFYSVNKEEIKMLKKILNMRNFDKILKNQM